MALNATPDAYGLPRVLHPYRKTRPGQSRGVPDLAPVIEMLKSMSNYTDNELHASVVASLLTVFVKSVSGSPNLSFQQGAGSPQTDSQINTDGLKLGSGSVVGLLPGEDIEIVDSKRPNTAAEAFINAMAEQVGVALELPKEVLLKHFTSSYSAARAALLEAWRYFNRMRTWLVDEYCQPVWEVVIAEAVATGRLQAPGFFTDPAIRQAYLKCKWTGDAPGHIDEGKAVDAATKRMAARLTSLEQETAAMTGGDWEENQEQIDKESKTIGPSGEPGGAARLPVEGVNFDEIKKEADAYGVCVRAGAVTPQKADEEQFRTKVGLPGLSQEAVEAWQNDGGVRRPITLQSGDAFDAEQDAIVEDDDQADPDSAPEEKED